MFREGWPSPEETGKPESSEEKERQPKEQGPPAQRFEQAIRALGDANDALGREQGRDALGSDAAWGDKRAKLFEAQRVFDEFGDNPTEEIVDVLIGALNNPDVERAHALEDVFKTLGRCGEVAHRAVPVLAEMLEHPSCKDRALETLQQIGTSEAGEALLAHVPELKKVEPGFFRITTSESLRFFAHKYFNALARFQTEGSSRALIQALDGLTKENIDAHLSENTPEGGPTSDVIIRALGKTGTDTAFQRLLRGLERKDEEGYLEGKERPLIEALGEAGRKEAVQSILDAAMGPDGRGGPAVPDAVIALGKIGDDSDNVIYFVKNMGLWDERARRVAAKVLLGFGKKGRDALEEASNSGDEGVANAAKEVLRKTENGVSHH